MSFTKEQEELYLLYKNSKNSKIRDKYRVLILYKSGEKVKDLAKFYFVDENTISSWISRWEEKKDINDKQRSGRPPKLTKE
jgi:transposase